MNPNAIAHYKSAEGAARYELLYRSKLHKRVSDRVERKLIRRVFQDIGPAGRILDVPCGTGRLYPELRPCGRFVVETDFSYSMLERCRRNTDAAAYVNASAFELPYRDGAFDVVFSARLAHHLPQHTERDRYIHEIARVSRRYVVMTFFDQHSVKNTLRRLRGLYNRKRPKTTMAARELRAVAASAGMELLYSQPLSRLFSGQRYAVLRTMDSRDG